MKNREVRALATLLMTAALVTQAIYTEKIEVKAEGQQATSEQQSSDAGKTENKKQDQSEGKNSVYKDETVYVKLDNNGDKKEVVVSDQLKNVGQSQISDVSDLKDIENVKGDEKFSNENGRIKWQGAGEDIAYQGKTDKELPVDVKISYTLDGKKISADDLKGKSGHLVIRYDYENKTENKKYVPFVMVTGLVLKEGTFRNVQANSGKIISDGAKDIVVGMSIPGFTKEIGSDTIDIPDYFEVEADVEDFGSVEGMTVASNDILYQFDTDKLDEPDSMRSDLDRLSSSSRQLADGSVQLADGVQRLLDGTGALTQGVDLLATGGATLADKSMQLADGAKRVAEGGRSLAAGTVALSEGAAQTDEAVGSLQDGTKKIKSGTQQLAPGAKKLSDGIGQLKVSAQSGIGQLSQGVQSLETGLEKVHESSVKLKDGAASAADSVNALSENMRRAKAYETQQKGLVASAAGQIQAGTTTAQVPVNIEQYETTATVQADHTALRTNVEQALKNAGASPEEIAAALAVIAPSESVSGPATVQVNTSIQADIQLSDTKLGQDIQSLSAVTDSFWNTYGQISDGAGRLSQALNGPEGLKAGMGGLSGALSKDGQLFAGMEKLGSGVTQIGGRLSEGADQLETGVSVLAGAGKSLSEAMANLDAGASRLKDGTSRLAAASAVAAQGADTLSKGAASVSDGASALGDGAGTLSAGLSQMKEKAAPLTEGVQALHEGAVTLSDGMKQFDEEGIQKLVSTVEDEFLSVADKLHDTLNPSNKYSNFSGISDGMDGEVKFIFISGE